MTSTNGEERIAKSERLRNLEILKYGSSVRINYDGDSFPDTEHAPPRLADDAILTALCQLVALRLDCLNAFICLIDLRRQHVIAEATRTLSPYDASIHAPNDGLMFGVQSFDQAFGITQVTLPAYTRGPGNFVNNHFTSIDDQRSVFLDLGQEPLLEKIPFLRGNTTHKFYVEVPVMNLAGVVIGVLGVLDHRARSSFDKVDVRPMLDTATMVMEHLELVRLKNLNAHAERLLQGLGHFNAGQSSIHQWIQDHPTRVSGSDPLDINRHAIDGRSDTRNTDTEQSQGSVTLSATTPSTQFEQYFGSEATVAVSASGTKPLSDDGTRLQASHSSVERLTMYALPSATVHTPEAAVLSRSALEVPAMGLEVVSPIQQVFPRAANLIREALDLDASCFLEMPSDSRFKIDHPGDRDKYDQASQDSCPNIAAVDQHETSASLSSDSEAKQGSSDGQLKSGRDESPDPIFCKCTALSTKLVSGLINEASGRPQIKMPERALASLALLYPMGHIFQFDAHGLLSSGDDLDEVKKVTNRRSWRRHAIQAMSDNFPRARSVLFIPFYSGEQQKMYSAFFGWIEDAFRVLVDSDLVYITGFAHSVMCEVLRLETLMTDKAKSVFMSSISHELRSPLHGILAATELLRESNLTSEQNELALMTDSCGRTLLDIMTNLLEHAKINNAVENRKPKKKGKGRLKSRARSRRNVAGTIENLTTTVSLAEIAEETISSVVSGHAIRTQRAEQVSIRRRLPADTIKYAGDLGQYEPRPPTVILNIQNTSKWFVQVDPGVWRRIIMNLTGNALKYTSTGHVVAELSLTDVTTTSRRQSSRVVFTVTDSGQGMSESYMKGSLFTPFTQEDQLSVGAGLGLSIVHRLITDLQGEIKIDSEIDVGTKVQVVIPLPTPTQPGDLPAFRDNDPIMVARSALGSGDTVCLQGFDLLPTLDSVPTGTMSALALGFLKLKQSLILMFSDWFGVSTTSDMQSASICVVESSHAQMLREQDPSNAIFSKKCIIVSAYDETKISNVPWPGNHSAIATPIGPVKLARALAGLFEQRVGKQEGEQAEHNSRTPASGNNVAVPAKVVAENRSSVGTSSINRPEANGPRILLVDDNDINTRILAGIVRKLGNPYATARNGQDALDQFIAAYEQEQPFHYIFMDISMPIMDGLASTRRIREYEKKNRRFQPAQIFALTGLGHLDTQDEAIASGVDQYFRKPVRLDTLRRAIAPVG